VRALLDSLRDLADLQKRIGIEINKGYVTVLAHNLEFMRLGSIDVFSPEIFNGAALCFPID
jgi:hypothetical protein